ncbi:MAG: DUF695 domain-containing protein [Odoribacter sp.]|nr:DUF695 domain-containing protein [Odoribacter sp.]
MSENHDWWTAPAITDDGKRDILVSGRRDITRFRNNKRFCIRIEISWTYNQDPDAGMPNDETARIMGDATDNMIATFDADPVAVLTGIFTGAGERTWVFYTLSTNIFQKKINEALAPLPLLPLHITAENDPAWEAYDEMSQVEVI